MRSLFRKILASQDYLRLFKNIIHLFFFQGINYLLPLITIPYIVRIVGPEKFGILSFAEVINRYFLMITDYGFNITGTQKISTQHQNPEARAQIFSTVLAIKFILMIGCFSVFWFIVLVWQNNANQKIFLLYFLMVPGNILLSYWFYLGMEEMQFLNYPNLIARIGFAVAVFMFLKNEEQFYLVPLFYGGFLILGGVVSLIFIKRRYHLYFKTPSIKTIAAELREGWAIFISTFAINLYRRSNTFLLGLVAPDAAVGFYSAGEKLIIAIQAIFNPVIQAFYPFISRRKSESTKQGIKDIQFLIKSAVIGTAFISLIIIGFASPITTIFLGKEFINTIAVVQIGSFVITLGTLNYVIGIIFMTNFGYQRQFAKSVIFTGIINVFFCLILSYYWQEIGAAIAFLLAELLLLLLFIIFLVRTKKQWSIEFE